MIPNVVVIPVKDQWRYTAALLHQLEQQNEADLIIVINNGSTNETTARLCGWEDVAPARRYVLHMPAAGIHEMWNEALQEARHLWYPQAGREWNTAILNNDLEIGPNFLTRLATCLRSADDVAIACPNYDQRPGVGYLELDQICAGRYDGTGGMPGFAFMIRGEDSYRFPEDMRWWYGDNDLLLYHLTNGRRCLMDYSCKVEHLDGGSRTGDWNSPDIQLILQADRAAFMAKWG